ncbi:PREDICTED: uncharacterized protein LOC105948939 [Erythranthe guttata]|uniref:uncharacterized protein LOC105948939 n=1 Tax=Erythranthe guttata TaxID=4155 RepID=UPI00064DC0B3|nr:PREDICTED: uncharacterized protein LOC105948939 [Erythranthe guttata]|eukprot:XP_012827654.1 PREDICTED: uncharacterized protein LOC105948939 [Erythranthe guttata]
MGGKVMLLLLVVMIVCGGCECKGGKVYKVGGSSGWTNIGPLPYKSWPSSIAFHVGDTLCKKTTSLSLSLSTLYFSQKYYYVLFYSSITSITRFFFKCFYNVYSNHLPPTILITRIFFFVFCCCGAVFEYKKEFHNVVRVTHTNFNNCNSTNPYHTWSTGNDSFTIPRHGHFYFICGVPGHCQSGQKIDIRVPISVPAPSPQSPSLPGPTSVSVAPAPSPKSGSSSLHLSWKLWVLVVAVGLPQFLS